MSAKPKKKKKVNKSKKAQSHPSFPLFSNIVEHEFSFYKWAKLILLVAFVAFFTFSFAGMRSFWMDELVWTIGILDGRSLAQVLQELLKTAYNLPLYYIILYPFYVAQTSPENWLLLPSIILAALAIVGTGKAAKEIGGERVSFVAFLIMTFNFSLAIYGATNLRPYALVVCLAAWSLFCYLRVRKEETVENIAIFGVLTLLMLYTHWYTCLFMFGLALLDFVLVLRKKISWKCLLAYICAGLLFLPWFFAVMSTHTNNLGEFWGGPVNIVQVYATIRYLFGESVWMFFAVFGAFLFVGVRIFMHKKQPMNNQDLWIAVWGVILWIFTSTYVYSGLINPAGSIVVYNYYIILLAPFSLCMAEAVVSLCSAFKPKTNVKIVLVFVLLFSYLGFWTYSSWYYSLGKWTIYYPYREVSDVLVDATKSTEFKSLVLSVYEPECLRYYLKDKTVNADFAYARLNRNEPFQNEFDFARLTDGTVITAEDLTQYDHIYMLNDKWLLQDFSPSFRAGLESSFRLFDSVPEYYVFFPSGQKTFDKTARVSGNKRVPVQVGLTLYEKIE